MKGRFLRHIPYSAVPVGEKHGQEESVLQAIIKGLQLARYFFTYLKKFMNIKLVPLAAAIVLFGACNNGSSKDSVEKADSANAAKSDSSTTGMNDSSRMNKPMITADQDTQDFLVKAANGNMAEVNMATLAKSNTKDSAVVNFADLMIKDHSAANEKVKALAAERNVTLPATTGDDMKDKKDDLSKKMGHDFDKAYVDAMVKDHKDDIDMFKKYSKDVKDPAVKTFIDNTLPTLEYHLSRIEQIKKGMK